MKAIQEANDKRLPRKLIIIGGASGLAPLIAANSIDTLQEKNSKLAKLLQAERQV